MGSDSLSELLVWAPFKMLTDHKTLLSCLSEKNNSKTSWKNKITRNLESLLLKRLWTRTAEKTEKCWRLPWAIAGGRQNPDRLCKSSVIFFPNKATIAADSR